MFFFIFIDEEKESQGRGQRLEVSAVNVSQVIMTLRADTLGVMTPLNSNILAISIKLTYNPSPSIPIFWILGLPMTMRLVYFLSAAGSGSSLDEMQMQSDHRLSRNIVTSRLTRSTDLHHVDMQSRQTTAVQF